MNPQRGEVYLVRFDPAEGSEIQKTRPALILQNDIANRYSPVTIVAAITSKFELPLYPIQVLISPPEGGLEADSVVALNQLRTIDKRRLIRRLGKLKLQSLQKVNQGILISLGLAEF